MCHKFLPHFELFFTLGVLFFKKQVFFKKLATIYVPTLSQTQKFCIRQFARQQYSIAFSIPFQTTSTICKSRQVRFPKIQLSITYVPRPYLANCTVADSYLANCTISNSYYANCTIETLTLQIVRQEIAIPQIAQQRVSILQFARQEPPILQIVRQEIPILHIAR